MNPMQMLKMMTGKMNPQQIVMNIVGKNNPMLNNMIQMANKGDTKGVEEVARNFIKEQGKDFDKEFNDFMSNFK